MRQKDIVKENNVIEQKEDAINVMKGVLQFLSLFLPITLAKRLVSMVLLAADVPVSRVTELTGLCDRSTRTLKKSMREEAVVDLLKLKQGSGKKSKTADVESEIVAELEKNNYHTRQQIADMIWEKFHIRISVSAVGKLLKKTTLKN